MLFGMAQLMLAELERELALLAARWARRGWGECATTLRLPGRYPQLAWAVPVAAALDAATLVGVVVNGMVDLPAAVGWVYLLVVLAVALRWGRVLGVLTAALAAILVLVLLVEPRLSLGVADARDARRLALSLAGMVIAVLLVQARDGRPWSARYLVRGSDGPTDPTSGPTRPAVNGHRTGHAGLSATREHHALSPFLGEATQGTRPARDTLLRGWPGASGSPGAAPRRRDAVGDTGGAHSSESLAPASRLALPAWLCASLLGTLAGVLLAKYGQLWAQTMGHPATVLGASIVVGSAALTFLAALQYVHPGAGGIRPRGVDRLLGWLSMAVVTLVGWGALAVIVVAEG